MKNNLVCLCSFVTEKEILDVLKKGATSVKQIQDITRAGTTCGRCLPQVDELVDRFLNKNQDEQTDLNFSR